jgi:hypothetical protein
MSYVSIDRWTTEIVAVLVAVVGLALVAVILGKNAKTTEVITSAGNAFTNIIGAAVKPVI